MFLLFIFKYNITYESGTSSQVENLNTQTTTSNTNYVNPNVFGGAAAASSNPNTLLVNDLNQDQLSTYKYSSALLDQTLIGYRSQQQQQQHPYYFSSHLSDRFSSSNYNSTQSQPQPHTRSHSLNNRNNY